MKDWNSGRRLILYIDGASRGNPGRAAAGIWITNGEGRKILERSRYLGHKTNNEAEYRALLLGLKEAKRLGGDILLIFTDSELVERQIKGVYRVKDLNLKALHKTAMEELKSFSSFEIKSIPREENEEADRLANQAIQRRMAKEKGGELKKYASHQGCQGILSFIEISGKEGNRRGTDGRSS